MSELDEIVERRRNQCAAILENLLAAPQVVLDKSLERSLPNSQGVYAIAQKGAPIGEYLHARAAWVAPRESNPPGCRAAPTTVRRALTEIYDG